MTQIRQGDVMLQTRAALPTGVVPESEPIVARGEATGHSHTLVADGPETTVRVFRDPADQRLYAQVMGGTATLTHQEHRPIIVHPGIYEVIGQREYRPEGIARVSD